METLLTVLVVIVVVSALSIIAGWVFAPDASPIDDEMTDAVGDAPRIPFGIDHFDAARGPDGVLRFTPVTEQQGETPRGLDRYEQTQGRPA